MNTFRLVFAASLVFSAGSCLAQITVPPPEKPTLPEEYTPVAPPPAPAVTVPTARPGQPVPPPDVKYEKLAKVGPDGKFIRLAEPAEWVAVKTNPMVKPEMMAAIEQFKAARIRTYETIVIQNLNAIDQVRTGILEDANPGEKEKFGGIVGLVKPLTAPNAPVAFATALSQANLLSAEQASLSRKMASEYALEIAAGPELVKQGKRGPAEKGLVEVLKQRLEEPLYVYRKLQIEASGKMESLLTSAVSDAEVRSRAMKAAGSVGAAATDDQRVAAMNAAEKELTIDQRKAMYQAMIDGRAK